MCRNQCSCMIESHVRLSCYIMNERCRLARTRLMSVELNLLLPVTIVSGPRSTTPASCTQRSLTSCATRERCDVCFAVPLLTMRANAVNRTSCLLWYVHPYWNQHVGCAFSPTDRKTRNTRGKGLTRALPQLHLHHHHHTNIQTYRRTKERVHVLHVTSDLAWILNIQTSHCGF